MDMLKEYFSLQKKIHEYFGYKEDWVAIPLEDGTEFFWSLTGEGHGDEVLFADTREVLLDTEKGDHYSHEIYTQRFLPKWVYRGEAYTMVVVDTHVDGNKFLQVFDNAKEVIR